MWLALALIAATAAVYAPARHFAFVSFDDPEYVAANPTVAAGLTWSGVRWAFTSTSLFYWHPLTWLSHMLDVELYGVNAGAHHVTNVLIHIASTVVLLGALNRMTGAPARSAFVAGLFALHPLHVESVAWVAERKDVLSGLFWMLTLWVYADYVRRPGALRQFLVALFFAAALMSKPMAVTLPLVLLLLDYWPLGRVAPGALTRPSSWLPLVREKLPLFIVLVPVGIITIIGQSGAGAVVGFAQLPIHHRIANAFVSYVAYLGDMVWPAVLAAFYPFIAPSDAAALLAALAVVGATVAAALCARRLPYVTVGWFWYVITLAPVIGLVQAGGQARADRFTYIPLIGVFIALTWAVSELAPDRRAVKAALSAAAVALLALAGFASSRQVVYWKDSLALWGRALAVTRENYRAENHYGAALADEKKTDEAIEHYSRAIAVWPEYAEAHNNLGTALAEKGKTDDAMREFAAAARIKPNDPTFHYNLGAMLNTRGDRAGAVREMRAAERLSPGNPDIARALETLGERPSR